VDVESLAKQLILQNMTPEQQQAVLDSVRASLQEARSNQKRRVSENVGMVVDALKKIEADIRAKYDDLGNKITARVNSIRDGRDGVNGSDGRDGQDGRPGRDGAQGPAGPAGRDGVNGVDGQDGVSVTDAKIDFDGSLIISLSNGREINVGEVVAPDLAEKIKVITNGGGTSQYVLDTLASLQTQINNLIPSQTGNSGKFLTTNGSVLSWASVAGNLSYQGTWNASTNTPTLASGTGTNGYYYVVATAGSTNLDGITDWKVGDWLLFNGTAWQKIDQSETLQTITSTDGSVTVTTVGSNADLSVAVAASTTNVVVYVRNTTGATLTKGTAVYINGATGQNPTVTKAQANNDTNSAQTLGLMTADLANNSNGYVTVIGLITNIDTSAFADGDQLYLSPTTAGALTTTKPYAPQHLVYVAVVEHAHPTQGKLFVKVQNGYEMDELHNVSAQSPSNGHVLIYNATTDLWESHTLTDGTGITITEGAGSITVANSGVTSAVAGTGISVSGATGAVTITNSAPDQTVSLTGAGTTSISGTYPNFTITSNDQYTGTVTSVSGTSPVASSGGATPAISLSSGYGDTQNPYASKTANYVLAAPNGTAGAPTFRAIVAADIPTLNQNTTGTASNVTGIVAASNGGTGQSSLTSNNVLLGNGTSSVNFVAPGANGNVLTSDGTTWTSAAASSSGFPSGTLMLFQQTSAPTGWTKQTTHDNKALRVVSGAASSGGSVAFTTAFASKSVSGTVGGTTLTVTQIPAHSHSTRRFSSGSVGSSLAGSISSATTVTASPVTTDTGGGSSHDHTFTGTAIDLAVQYVDLIIASKD